MKGISLLLTFCFISFISPAQSWQDTVSKIEKLFTRYQPANPGCQLVVSRNGTILFSKAWGMADLEHDIKLTTLSKTEAGSVSKQFTAAAILLLEQQGKLSLNDEVHKYLPELPDYGTPITLRQMMQHTSGLRDWGSMAELSGWPRTTKTYSNSDVLTIVSRQRSLNHLPGAEFSYSNSNYNLFAIIVERVSGMNLAQFTKKYIFDPAGMQHTEWRDDFRRIVAGRALAYDKSGDHYETDMPNENAYGNGGLLTTAEDLAVWNQYYLSGKFGSPSLLPQMLHTTPLNNGGENNYGAGLTFGEYRGWKYIAHNGSTAGYRSNLEQYPETGLSFAWLSNTSEFDDAEEDIFGMVEDIFLPKKTAAVAVPAKKEQPAIYPLTAAALGSFAGWYQNQRTGQGIRLVLKEDKLYYSPKAYVVPIAPNVFTDGKSVFSFRSKGFLHMITAGKDTIPYKRMDSVRLGDDLQQYTGSYYSAEADARFRILLQKGHLLLHRETGVDIPLSTTYKDGFIFPGGIVFFERDKKNAIKNMKVSIARARKVEFVRVWEASDKIVEAN
jgi:CubicO group peptidase (beta-lactamase class C family)